MAQVTIYTTPTCVYCKKTKEFFETNKIAYTEKNVVADDMARNEMVQKSGQLAVPVVDIDGSIVVGFNPAELSKLLGI